MSSINFHASWSEVYRSDKVLAIIDKDEGKSITNDAEWVVQQLRPLDGQRILYRDTEGRWDELQHSDGTFTGFGHIGVRDLGLALKRLGAQVPSC